MAAEQYSLNSGLISSLGTYSNQGEDLGQSALLLNVGDVLKARFEIIELLGEGGMGRVFKAIDARKTEAKSRNPYVAIKVLSPALARNTFLIAGLQRECEKAQELSHPNIITVYDFDIDGDYVFMSMEFLAGRPLSKIIFEARQSGGIAMNKAWPIICNMGEALVYAHKKNIVHSDFKPANVFITDQDEVKVLDFGIASRFGQTNADETIFDARAEGGLTPPYASFEMLNGSRADPRDDIYAFGLVVYEILTGRHPYDRKPASTIFLEQRSGQRLLLNPIPGLSRKQWKLLKSVIEILQEQRPKQLNEWLAQFNPQAQFMWKRWGARLFLILLFVVGITYLGWFSKLNDVSLEQNVVTNDMNLTPASSDKKPVVNMLPIANSGQDQQIEIGDKIVLDASESITQDDGPLQYAWRITDQPVNSNVILINSDSVTPEFTPDQVGDYKVELVVTDASKISSRPNTVLIQVVSNSTRINLSEASSQDGVLYLASSKENYKIGEELVLRFRVNQAGYMRVAHISSSGEIGELLPNKYQSSQIKPGQEYRIPPKADSFKMQVTGPPGSDKVVAVFSLSPIAKVKNIVTADAELVTKLQHLVISTATIQFQVLNY